MPWTGTASLTLTLGGMSKEFRLYHGVGGEMGAPIIADDFELIRYEPKPPAGLAPLAVWDAKKELAAVFDWSAKDQWSPVESPAHTFAGTPVIQGRHLAGAVRKSDGGLAIYCGASRRAQAAMRHRSLPALPAPKCTLVQRERSDGHSG